jgi:hypothetical protein
MTEVLRPLQGGFVTSYDTNDDLNSLARSCPPEQIPEVGLRWADHIIEAVADTAESRNFNRFGMRILRLLQDVDLRVLDPTVESLTRHLQNSEEAEIHSRLTSFLEEARWIAGNEHQNYSSSVELPKSQAASGEKLLGRLRQALRMSGVIEYAAPAKTTTENTRSGFDLADSLGIANEAGDGSRREIDLTEISEQARRAVHKAVRDCHNLDSKYQGRAIKQIANTPVALLVSSITGDGVLEWYLTDAERRRLADMRTYAQTALRYTEDLDSKHFVLAEVNSQVTNILEKICFGSTTISWQGETSAIERQWIHRFREQARSQLSAAAEYYLWGSGFRQTD